MITAALGEGGERRRGILAIRGGDEMLREVQRPTRYHHLVAQRGVEMVRIVEDAPIVDRGVAEGEEVAEERLTVAIQRNGGRRTRCLREGDRPGVGPHGLHPREPAIAGHPVQRADRTGNRDRGNRPDRQGPPCCMHRSVQGGRTGHREHGQHPQLEAQAIEHDELDQKRHPRHGHHHTHDGVTLDHLPRPRYDQRAQRGPR